MADESSDSAAVEKALRFPAESEDSAGTGICHALTALMLRLHSYFDSAQHDTCRNHRGFIYETSARLSRHPERIQTSP